MTKDDILAYLSQQMQRTQGVYVAEQNLARRQEIYNETKQMWKKRIIACFVLGVMGLFSGKISDLGVALLFIGIGCALLYFKHLNCQIKLEKNYMLICNVLHEYF